MNPAVLPDAEESKYIARILIVEDERVVALDLSSTLEKLGYAVIGSVISGAEAIECAREQRPDLILMDIRLNGKIDGIDAAQEIHLFLNCPVIFLTAYSDEQTLHRAKQVTPFGYLVKPFKMLELRCTIEVALHKNMIEERLREQERWFSTTLRSLSDAVIATDPANKIRFLNPSAELLTGWGAKEAQGREIREILEPVRIHVSLPEVIRRNSGTFENISAPVELQTYFVNRQGETVEIDDATAPIVDDSGMGLGQVMVFRDITEQRRNLEEIRQLTVELERRVAERTDQLQTVNEQLLSATNVKSEFLNRMSRELRIPLNSIIGFSKLFLIGKIGELTDNQRKYIRFVCESGDHLLSLVNDILDLSKIGTGNMVLELKLLDIKSELNSCLVIVWDQARKRNIDVQVVPFNAMHLLLADRRKFKQIILNLLSNAVKYTRDGGSVNISAREVRRDAVRIDVPAAGSARLLPLPEHDFQEFIEIAVADNGIGIEDLDRILQAFTQFDTSLAREGDGTGLGLSLVKQLTELHGGTVAVSSIPGHGATFVIWLPLRIEEQAKVAVTTKFRHLSGGLSGAKL
ncbi:MAG: ATP-binding protein [Pseudomonadota bacterium]